MLEAAAIAANRTTADLSRRARMSAFQAWVRPEKRNDRATVASEWRDDLTSGPPVSKKGLTESDHHPFTETALRQNVILMTPLALATLIACSSSPSGGVAASAPAPSRVDNGQSLHWAGSFQQVQQQSGNLGPRSTNKVYGKVSLTRASETPTSIHARVELSTTVKDSRQLHWAVSDGQCGSSTLPLLAIEQFPQINISSNGRGQLDADIPLALTTTGSYHVDVYWTNGQDQGDVMTCANVRLDNSR